MIYFLVMNIALIRVKKSELLSGALLFWLISNISY